MIDHTDIKIYLLNITTLILSYSDIMDALKLLALCISIGYTIHKWWIMYKTNKK